MQGTIAQVVSLTTYGNAFLSDAQTSATGFYPTNSTFRFCEYVRFVDWLRRNGTLEQRPFAPEPVAWFESVRRDGMRSFRMSYGPSGEKNITDRMLVGFVGGGGRWLIEAAGSEHSDYWEARWQVGDRNRPDKRIWQVTYGRIASDQPPGVSAADDLDQLKELLRRNLADIGKFARSQNLDGFAKAFESGLLRLDSGTPLEGLYHNDVAPADCLPQSAYQLLGAVQAAWVFGGMGSWNDVGFDGASQERYDELSETLYQVLNRAIVASANSGAPSATATKT